jgi:aminoglycoside phosphotransferase family enzyme
MTTPPEQAEVVEFLRGLAGSGPLETHISLVFVGADTVWKLKKAVRLVFLDFTSIESRRRFALRELELNSAAAPGLYRDVVPVVRHADGALGLGDPGDRPAIDWVLRMARVPAGDFLDTIAMAGGLHADLLDALGDAVAAFHRGLPPSPRSGVNAMRTSPGNARPRAMPACLKDTVQAWRRESAALDGMRRG